MCSGDSKFFGYSFRRFFALVADGYNFYPLLGLQTRNVSNACIVPGTDDANTNDL